MRKLLLSLMLPLGMISCKENEKDAISIHKETPQIIQEVVYHESRIYDEFEGSQLKTCIKYHYDWVFIAFDNFPLDDTTVCYRKKQADSIVKMILIAESQIKQCK